MTNIDQLKDSDEIQIALKKLYAPYSSYSFMHPFIGAQYTSKAKGHIRVMVISPFMRGTSFGLKDDYYTKEGLKKINMEIASGQYDFPQVRGIFDGDAAAVSQSLDVKTDVVRFLEESDSGYGLEDIAYCCFIQRPIATSDKSESISSTDRSEACQMLEKVLDICKPDVVILMSSLAESTAFGVRGFECILAKRLIDFILFEDSAIAKKADPYFSNPIDYEPEMEFSLHVVDKCISFVERYKRCGLYDSRKEFADLTLSPALPTLRKFYLGFNFSPIKLADRAKTIQSQVRSLLDGSATEKQKKNLLEWTNENDPFQLEELTDVVNTTIEEAALRLCVKDVRWKSSKYTPEELKKKQETMRRTASSYKKKKK